MIGSSFHPCTQKHDIVFKVLETEVTTSLFGPHTVLSSTGSIIHRLAASKVNESREWPGLTWHTNLTDSTVQSPGCFWTPCTPLWHRAGSHLRGSTCKEHHRPHNCVKIRTALLLCYSASRSFKEFFWLELDKFVRANTVSGRLP